MGTSGNGFDKLNTQIMLKGAEKMLWRLGVSPVAPRAAAAPWPTASASIRKSPVTVILDKDGTLLDFHSMWTPWAMANIERMVSTIWTHAKDPEAARNVGRKALRLVLAGDKGRLDVPLVTSSDSPMAHFSTRKMHEISMATLQDPAIMGEYKVSVAEAKAAVNAWVDDIDPASVTAVANAERWCRDMVGHGAELAICTSDSRINTEVGLKAAKMNPGLFTTQLCADDPDYVSKPNPTNIRTVCAKLCVAAAASGARPVMWPAPEQVVMVGDSPLDVEMGVAAGCRSVGVLTGVSTAEQLARAGATTVAPSLGSVYIAPDTNALHTDVLVVGGGSAGCTVAARLAAADSSLEVTMLEAGRGDRAHADSWQIHMPAALTYNIGHPNYDWCYETVPQPHLEGRKLAWPRGKVLGGSSSLNAMVYVRGHPADYDRWAAEGAVGWGWKDVVPYFRKSETYSHYNHKVNGGFRGNSGPLHVTQPPVDHPITAAFLKAGGQAGYPIREDLNSVHCGDGLAPMDFTIHEGKRWSAAEAHLGADSGPPLDNLRVTTGVHTHRVLFAGNRAIGVEASLDGPGGPTTPIYAEKVVLAAGSINTPQLLMLSGIGDAEDLHTHGIDCRSHLPGVGKNLQDHMEIYVQQFSKSKNTLYGAQWQFPHTMVGIGLEWIGRGTGWGGTNHMEAGGFVKSHDGVDHPNLQVSWLSHTACHPYCTLSQRAAHALTYTGESLSQWRTEG